MLLAQHKDILITNSAHCTKRLSHTDAQNYKQLAGSLLGVEETREGAVSWRLRGCCPFNHPIRTSRACLNQPISALAWSPATDTPTRPAWREEIQKPHVHQWEEPHIKTASMWSQTTTFHWIITPSSNLNVCIVMYWYPRMKPESLQMLSVI